MKDFLNRALSLFVLSVYSAGLLPAAEWSRGYAQARQTLDFYAERAAVYDSREDFERVMNAGLDAARAEWESLAEKENFLSLDAMQAEKAALEEELESRRDSVFKSWLLEKKQAEIDLIKKSELFNILKEAADNFYYVDSDGNESRIVSKENIQEAESQWKAQAEKIVSDFIDGYKKNHPETEWPPASEFDSIKARLSNALGDTLLYDHDSLKKMTDDEAARIIAENLAAQVEYDTRLSMQALFDSMQENPDAHNAGGVEEKDKALNADLKRFEEELSRGLEKWNQAEDEFLLARVEWEKSAEKIFIDGNEKWQAAYEMLEKRKAEWAEKMAEEIRSGKIAWKNKADTLAAEIDEYLLQFQEKLALESAQKDELAVSEAASYAEARDILLTAQQGVTNWYGRWGEKYRGLYSYWKTEDTDFGLETDLSIISTEKLKNDVLAWKEKFLVMAKTLFSSYSASSGANKKIIDSCSVKSSAAEIESLCAIMLSERNSIRLDSGSIYSQFSDEYWEFLGNASTVWGAADELFEWLLLFDTYSDRSEIILQNYYNATAGSLSYINEIQNEKLKVNSLVNYWEKRVSLAEAVLDYAENRFSNLETEEETRNNLSLALENYNQKKEEYQKAVVMLDKKREEVSLAGENYMAAADAATEAAGQIEAEKALYDELYDQVKLMENDGFLGRIVTLMASLERLELSETAFRDELIKRCEKIQQEENQRLLNEIEKIKSDFEKGSSGVEYDSSVFEGLALSDEMADAKTELDGAMENNDYGKILSTLEIEEIRDKINLILEAPVFDVEEVEKILGGIRSLDAYDYEELSEAVSAFKKQKTEENLKNVYDSVQKISAFCDEELLSREAVLLLFDGSAEEIHAWFEENKSERTASILEDYSKYSFALLNEKNEETRKKIAQKEELSDSDFISPALSEMLRLYEKALLESQADFSETEIEEKIREVFDTGIVKIEAHDFNLPVFESLLGSELPASLTYGKDLIFTEGSDYDFDGICSERKKILDKILEECALAEEPMKNLILMNSRLKEQGEKIQAAQDLYEEKVRLLRGSEPDSALNLYLKACGEYNEALLFVDGAYENLEDSRNHYRTCEEIYFYAQNEYLHGTYDAQGKLDEARLKLENARTALSVLDALGDGNKAPQDDNPEYQKINSEYKESYVKYYKARVLLYEYEKEIAEQKERLLAAEQKEQKALTYLVTEFSGLEEGGAFTLPPYVQDLVNVSLSEDGSFNIGLSNGGGLSDEEEKALFYEYFTDECLEYTGIDGSVYRSSRAKADALDFLCGMQGKPYSLEELSLAALSLKLNGNYPDKSGWLKDDENPYSDSNYPLASIPEEIHGVLVWSSYSRGRYNVLNEAAQKVAALDKDNDLAKYILFSETCLASCLNLYSREHDYLSTEALKAPIDSVSSQEYSYMCVAVSFFAVAASYYAIAACGLFGTGLWALVPAAAATAVAVTFKSMADKLGEVKKDLKGIRNGIYANLEKARNDSARYFEIWSAAVRDRKEQRERLNILLCGRPDTDEGEITWEDFDAAMNCMFESGNTHVRYSFFGDMKELFDEISSDRVFTSTGDVIEQMNFLLNRNFMEKEQNLSDYLTAKSLEKNVNAADFYSELDSSISQGRRVDEGLLQAAAAASWGKDSVNRSAVSLDLLDFYNNEILKEFPVRLGSSVEKYTEDTIENIREEYAAAVYADQQVQMDLKLSYFALLEQDMAEQISLWNDKVDLAQKIGNREWMSAEEKINGDYNGWQKEWLLGYKEKDSLWQENYEGFLEGKQDWLFEQYSDSEKNSRPFKDASEIENYVSDICSNSALEKTLSLFRNINSCAANETVFIRNAFLEGYDSSPLLDYDEALKRKEILDADMQRAAAELSAQDFQRQLELDIKDYFEMIGQRNKSIEDWELNMVRAAGYSVDSEIHRDAIVDSTVFSTIRKRQTVHRYEYFKTAAPDTGIELSSYAGSSAHFIMSRVQEIQQKIQEWYLAVFGKKSDSGKELFEGALQAHIGKSPTFIENIDLDKSREENVLDFGSGQMGLIMLDFQWNSIKNSAGYAELSKAIYDQRLFDADLGWFKVPSIRDIAGVVLSVVEKVTGYVGISLIDDAFFGMLDIALEYKSFEDVAQSLGKSGLSLAATAGMSSLASSAAGSIAKEAGMSAVSSGSQVLRASSSALGSVAGSAVSSYINAFDFSRMTMDWDAAASVWSDSSMWTSAGGSIFSGALGEINNVDSTGLMLNQGVFKNIASMNSTIGDLGAAAMNYLLTGDLTLNLADIPLGKGKWAGILELGIHDGKAAFELGTGGVDVSPLAVKDFITGYANASRVSAMKASGAKGRTALDMANLISYSGREENILLSKALFDGEKNISFEDGGESSGGIRSEGNDFILDSALLSYTPEDRAKMALLLSIENSKLLGKTFAAAAGNEKAKTDYTLERMTDVAAVNSISKNLLKLTREADSEKIYDVMSKAYEEKGDAGIYAVYAFMADSFKKEAGLDEGISVSFENIMEKPWSQNDVQNLNDLLGESLSVAEYNKQAKENAVTRSVDSFRKKLNEENEARRAAGMECTPDSVIDEMCESYRTRVQSEIREGVKNEEYGYYPQTGSGTDTKNYGCTLATVAYIAYSITGDVKTLAEANEILKEAGLFVEGEADINGISQKNLIGRGDGYAAAVNSVAGGNYLEKDGEDFSITGGVYDVKGSDGKITQVDGTKKILDRLTESSKNTSEVYFTHMRVAGNSHSVLFKSLEYTAKTAAKDVKINVIDPWSTDRFTPKTLGDVNRADFYRLTEAGKEIYNLINRK